MRTCHSSADRCSTASTWWLGTTNCIPALCTQKIQPGSNSWLDELIKHSAWWTSRSSSRFPPTDHEAQPYAGALTSISRFPNATLGSPAVLGLSVAGLREDAAIPVPFLPSADYLPFQPKFPVEKDALQLSAVLFKCKTCISGELSTTDWQRGSLNSSVLEK